MEPVAHIMRYLEIYMLRFRKIRERRTILSRWSYYNRISKDR